jgi:hypothetical protein
MSEYDDLLADADDWTETMNEGGLIPGLAAAVRALQARLAEIEAATPATPVAWTSQDGLDNMARQRAEGLHFYSPWCRVDRPDDYNDRPLYTSAPPAEATP